LTRFSSAVTCSRSVLGDQLLLDGRVLLPGDLTGHLVGLLLQRLLLAEQALALVVEGEDAIDVGRHVAVGGVGLDGGGVLANEFDVQHDSSPVGRSLPEEGGWGRWSILSTRPPHDRIA
jgi:hypothetical protein